MNAIIEKVVIGVLGGLIGFALPYAAKIRETIRKAARIKSALINEAKFAEREIEYKMKWLSRDVSGFLNEVEEKRVVEYKGKKLYLGERESFDVTCRYWEEKYCEIAELLSESDFAFFADLHRQINNFVEKFRQMKEAFETDIGDPKWMASACYEDLIQIDKEISRQLSISSKTHK